MTSSNSGEGTRPVTDGTADNLGAGKGFGPEAANDSPGPREGMKDKRADRDSLARDGTAPLGIRQKPDDTPNTEPPGTARDNNTQDR